MYQSTVEVLRSNAQTRPVATDVTRRPSVMNYVSVCCAKTAEPIELLFDRHVGFREACIRILMERKISRSDLRIKYRDYVVWM